MRTQQGNQTFAEGSALARRKGKEYQALPSSISA
jgi:hypothetical protein